jgi:hypothetical protein
MPVLASYGDDNTSAFGIMVIKGYFCRQKRQSRTIVC